MSSRCFVAKIQLILSALFSKFTINEKFTFDLAQMHKSTAL